MSGQMTPECQCNIRPANLLFLAHPSVTFKVFFQKGRKGAGVKGAGVANCRIFRSAVPSVVVWSILLVSLSGVKKKL